MEGTPEYRVSSNLPSCYGLKVEAIIKYTPLESFFYNIIKAPLILPFQIQLLTDLECIFLQKWLKQDFSKLIYLVLPEVRDTCSEGSLIPRHSRRMRTNQVE